MIQIVDASGPEEIADVRALLLEYQAFLDVDLGFQGFAREVAELPGAYAPPSGRLLLARFDGRACGCIALQPISGEVCEMKRLYVRPDRRGSGLGRLLVARLVDEARSIGYGRMCLDTLPSMTRAAAMYEALGFQEIPPYRHNPVAGSRFMALSLA
ncbi:MAG: GNAT family N-acetyltransferase [Acidobacteria bacterium]|nr:GNAT family N-acetyltransferase [Acidobacteriota bacterium]MCA1610802.1 GNAT family N-acetyltransferase [Acidobacteriota bacterium]